MSHKNTKIMYEIKYMQNTLASLKHIVQWGIFFINKPRTFNLLSLAGLEKSSHPLIMAS